jgi:hypothetical protein
MPDQRLAARIAACPHDCGAPTKNPERHYEVRKRSDSSDIITALNRRKTRQIPQRTVLSALMDAVSPVAAC